MAKTDWTLDDVVKPEDLNQIGKEINGAKVEAQAALEKAEKHASRHAMDGEDPITPEQIGAETPGGAQEKADAAEQAAKAYTDQKVAAIPAPPVTSVNNKIGAVTLTKADVGLSSVDNVRQATKAEFDAHVANTNNPHGVTKAQVGLGNVQNYGIATQAEAQAGTSNSKYMTPLRTKEAITALTGGVPLRVNNGMLEYNDGSGWKPVGAVYSTRYKGSFTTTRDDGNEVTALSVNGAGRLVYLITQGGNSNATMRVLVDGVEVLNSDVGTDRSFHIARPDSSFTQATTRTTTATQIDLSFKTSLRILIRPKDPFYTASVYWLYEM